MVVTGTVRVRVRRCGVEEPNHRHHRLLRARRDRPTGRRTAEQRNEVATLHVCAHSITSSASESKLSEIVTLSSLAVFMLITSSNLTTCCTGKSAGFAPLRILAVWTPYWRYAR